MIHSLSTVTHTNGGVRVSDDWQKELTKGHLFSKEFTSNPTLLEWLDRMSQSTAEHILFLSRTPHRRLLDHVDITKVETYWMTHRVGQAHIPPELETIHNLVASRTGNHHGVIVIEGLEWLVSLHGESTLLNFIRTLRDLVHRSQWSVLLPISALAFDAVWLARFKREAPEFQISTEAPTIGSASTEDDDDEEAVYESTVVTEEGLPELVMLTKLPKNGFNRAILRKRILQWRRMGLDVSELEPSLHLPEDESYSLYHTVELKVRKAIELDRIVDLNATNMSASQLTTYKFRLRQLTGLKEIEGLLQHP